MLKARDVQSIVYALSDLPLIAHQPLLMTNAIDMKTVASVSRLIW